MIRPQEAANADRDTAVAMHRRLRLQRLLSPRSVALVGIPGDLKTPLARPLRALKRHGFAGPVYPVNPRHSSIGGTRCYPRISALPGPVDVAWIAVPAEHAARTLAECADWGIRSAVVASSGFAETGDDGAARQAALLEVARSRDVAVLGPNSIGFVNCPAGIPLTFSGLAEASTLLPGRIAVLSQSGGLGGSVANRLQDRRIGLSYLLSTGNEMDIGLIECLEFLVDDERTDAIVLIVETVRDGGGFIEAARRALDAGKAIIALRLGTSVIGQQVAASHTGALAGSLRAWNAVTAKLGVVITNDLGELVDAAVWWQRARRGRPVQRVAIVTTSGGAAIHVADRLSAVGIDVPPLPSAAQDELRTILPQYARPANPLDVTAGLPEETFVRSLTAVARGGQCDAIVLPINMLAVDQASARITALGQVGRDADIAVAVCHFGGSLAAEVAGLCDRMEVAAFSSASALAWTARASGAFDEVRRREQARKLPPPIEPIMVGDDGLLPYMEACRLLERCAISLPRQTIVTDVTALGPWRGLSYPVAAKVVGRAFAHKTERRAIRLDLETEAELIAALADLDRTTPSEGREGILVQEMVAGVEVIVGVVRDPTFGLLLLIGRGGIATELAEDHRWLLLPVTGDEVYAAVASIGALRMLDGYRGMPGYDRHALVEAVLCVQQLALALGPKVEEIEVNPLMVCADGQGCRAVDVLIRASGGD